jgi:hypothetical protein
MAKGGYFSNVLDGLAQSDAIQRLSLFRITSPLGYGLVVGHSDDSKAGTAADPAYKAIHGVASACAGFLSEFSDFTLMAFPMVVIQAPLLRATLDDHGALDVQPIRSGVLAWRNPRLAAHSFITVATEEALSDLLPVLRKDIAVLQNAANMGIR